MEKYLLKKCTLCKQEKHRRRFLTKKGVLDYRCVDCRALPMDAKSIRKRVAQGLTSEDKQQKLRLAAAKRKIERYTAGVKAYQVRLRKAEWERVKGSAEIAEKLLRNYPFAGSEHPWRDEVRNLLTEAKKVIRQRSRKEFNKGDKALFWYDASPEIYSRLCELIVVYPQGADKCPIQVM